RYNDDGYGEHADGAAFDGTGIGRGWPLLAGERGHFELARGNSSEARCLLAVMSKQSGKGGLIPEQIWDADDIPARELVNGCPSGSAMPLVWAHAEYVKLARSIEDGRPFDTPPQTVQRYIARHRRSRFTVWRFNNKARTMRPRTTLRIETAASATIRWSHDDWHTVIDTGGKDTTMGLWVADLDTKSLPEGTNVRFTMFWPDADKWEGRDYHVRVKTENSDASSNR
ncbi:MAG: glucan 1,4-alpha-glucosidase, partial [Gemmatimonadaceae bacterium]